MASVKALEGELAELKDDQGRTRMLMEQLAKCAKAAEAKVIDVSDQLASVGTQLALVFEERNGKTLSLVTCRPDFATAVTASMWCLQNWRLSCSWPRRWQRN